MLLAAAGQRLLSGKELAQLWAHYQSKGYRYELLRWRNISAVGLLLWQGLDGGEQATLRVEQLDLERGQITLPSRQDRAARVLPLEKHQILPLYRYVHQDRPKLLGQQPDEGWLWVSHRGGQRANKELIQSLLRPHRHLLPSHQLTPTIIRMSLLRSKFEQGWSLSQVQYFAGHRYPSSTARYRPNEQAALEAGIHRHPLQ